jgi:hypothetical protein
MASPDDLLVHVHFGRALLDRLAGAGLPGQRLEASDPVCDGPTPGDVDPNVWYQVRAAHLHASPGAPPAAAIEADLRAQDEALAAAALRAEVVLWAGPELYCQVSLVRALARLGELAPPPRLSLVDPGDHAGSPGCGLTARSDEELRALFAARRPVEDDVLALAARAWSAYTAPSARPLVALCRDDLRALPHLRAALLRHLEDLPDGATGLSTTETKLLQALEAGPLPVGELLRALARTEDRPFLTDTMLGHILRRLGAGPAPLVTVEDADEVLLTAQGRDVLHGHAFWSAERWHGGVHIRREEDEMDDGGPPPAN